MAKNLDGWKMTRKESGGEVLPGTTQLDQYGKEWQVRGVRREPQGDYPGHIAAWRSDRGEVDLFPDVFGLVIAPEEGDPDWAEHAVHQAIEEMALGGVSGLTPQQAAEAVGVIVQAAMESLANCVAASIQAAAMAAYLKGVVAGKAALK